MVLLGFREDAAVKRNVSNAMFFVSYLVAFVAILKIHKINEA